MARSALDIKHYRGFLPLTVLCLLLLYGPLIIVMIYSFNDSLSITVGATEDADRGEFAANCPCG